MRFVPFVSIFGDVGRRGWRGGRVAQHFSLAEKLAGREDASDINLNLSRNDESIVRLRPLSISVLEFVDRGRRLELLQVSLAWGI
jgi:hypothetical protein